MKKGLLFALVTLLFQTVSAQDLIIKLNGDEVSAHVLEIRVQDILYKLPDQIGADTLRIPKQEVFMVRFANGTREVFTESLPENQVAPLLALSPEQMYLKGQQDAAMYYQAKGIMAGSAGLTLTALFTYGLGLAGPIAMAATPPKAHNFTVPDQALLSNPDYVSGYRKRAQKRKVGKTLVGVGIGAVTGVVVGMVVAIAALSSM